MSLDDSSSEEENMEIYFSTDEELWVLRLGKGVNSSVAALLLLLLPGSLRKALAWCWVAVSFSIFSF